MLPSFSQSCDHPYYKSLSQTMIVGAHHGAGMKIHYVKIDGLHDQHLSQ
jgi:hypothetical protein